MEDQRKKRLLRALLIWAIVLSGCAFVLIFIRPPCPFFKYGGFYCAGCGAQRMLYALLSGDIARAFRYNPFIFFALPAFIIWMAAETVLYVKSKDSLYKKPASLVILSFTLVIAIVFTILRNIPSITFLGP